jgi:alpha-L-fucosidase 2
MGRCLAHRKWQDWRNGIWRCLVQHIQLNEDTIWNGKTRDRINPQALKPLPEVRRLLFAGKPAKAEALEERTMMGIPNRQPPYQPLGDLDIAFMSADNATDYRRELDLATGVVPSRTAFGTRPTRAKCFRPHPMRRWWFA